MATKTSDPALTEETFLVLLRSLEAYSGALRRASRLVERLDIVHDDVARELEHLRSRVETLAASRLGRAHIGLLSLLPPPVKKALERAAASGIRRLEIRPLRGGRGVARLEDYPPVKLTPKLALLLSILARGKPVKAGGLVPWKSLVDIATELQKGFRALKPPSAHAVTQLLSRLREALLEKGINPFLIQTAPSLGARLAYNPGAAL